MSIRIKVWFVIFIGVLTCLGAGVYFQRKIITASFSSVEEKESKSVTERVTALVESEIGNLESKTGDWSYWDDIYRFVKSQNQNFVEVNVQDEAMAQLDINIIVVGDSKNQVYYVKEIDLEKGEETEGGKIIAEELRQSKLLNLSQDFANNERSGIIITSQGLLLFATKPILTSARQGPAEGILLFGKFLDERTTTEISTVAKRQIEIKSLTDTSLPENFREAKTNIGNGSDIYKKIISNDTLNIFSIIDDFQGNPVAIIKVEIGREYYLIGEKTISKLIIFVLILNTMFASFGILMIEFLVFRKLSRLGKEVNNLETNFSSRDPITMMGNDELGKLASSINLMIQKNKLSQEELKKREKIMEALVYSAKQFLSSDNWMENINETLRHLGSILAVERAYIFELHPGDEGQILASQKWEWVTQGITPQIDNQDMINMPFDSDSAFRDWYMKLRSKELISANIKDLEEPVRGGLEKQGIKTILIAPIYAGVTLWGFIGFDECTEERVWADVEKDLLRVAADLIGGGIEKNTKQEELQKLNQLMVGRELKMIEIKKNLDTKENIEKEVV
jgi:sensor domain CHASE-containing protein